MTMRSQPLSALLQNLPSLLPSSMLSSETWSSHGCRNDALGLVDCQSGTWLPGRPVQLPPAAATRQPAAAPYLSLQLPVHAELQKLGHWCWCMGRVGAETELLELGAILV